MHESRFHGYVSDSGDLRRWMWTPGSATATNNRLLTRSTAHPIPDADPSDARGNDNPAAASNSHSHRCDFANSCSDAHPYAAADLCADCYILCADRNIPSAG